MAHLFQAGGEPIGKPPCLRNGDRGAPAQRWTGNSTENGKTSYDDCVGVGWPELGTFSGPGRACMSGLEGDGGEKARLRHTPRHLSSRACSIPSVRARDNVEQRSVGLSVVYTKFRRWRPCPKIPVEVPARKRLNERRECRPPASWICRGSWRAWKTNCQIPGS